MDAHDAFVFDLLARVRREQALLSLESFLGKRKCKPEVAARIRRLNPNGLEQGLRVRGYRGVPGDTLYWYYDIMRAREFVAKFGRAAYDKALRTKGAIIRHGHRKGVKFEYVQDNF